MTDKTSRPTCFIAMPLTTHPEEAKLYGDEQHWFHVMETLFVPAIEKAGYAPIRPKAHGSNVIHAEIVKHLETADMVLCDLSSHNPNVFFELGVRTSLDKPIALAKDEHTRIPFDMNGVNTHDYLSTLPSWEIGAEVTAVAQHLVDAAATCGARNPMWQRFGLTQRAEQPALDASPADAQLQLIFDSVNQLRAEMTAARRLDNNVPMHQGPMRDALAQVSAMLGAAFGASQWNVESVGPHLAVLRIPVGDGDADRDQIVDAVNTARALGLDMAPIRVTEGTALVTLKTFAF